MRFVVAALVLLVIVVVVLAVGMIVTQGIRGRRGWRLEERSDGERVSVYASKPGAQDLLLGSVAVSAPDFDMQLYELRAEADERLRVLNDRRDSR